MYPLANQRAVNAAQTRFDNANPYDLSPKEEKAAQIRKRMFLKKKSELNEKLYPQDLMDVLQVLNDEELQHIANFLQKAGKARTIIERGIEVLADEAAQIAAENYLKISNNSYLAGEVYIDLITAH